MSQEQHIEIDYKESIGGCEDDYKIVLTGEDLSDFQNNPELAVQAGEPLMTSIIETGGFLKLEQYKNGILVYAALYKNSLANDGENGEPAERLFMDDGKLFFTARHKDGLCNDGVNGEPACCEYNQNGKLVYTKRLKDGYLNDAADGEAAVRHFDISGELICEERYKDGQKNDGKNGEPAYLELNGGRIVHAERWKDGALVKRLNAGEIAAYQKEFDKAQTVKPVRPAVPKL